MQNNLCISALALCVLAGSLIPARGDLINGGFETGDLSGWIATNPTGIPDPSWWLPGTPPLPSGIIKVVSTAEDPQYLSRFPTSANAGASGSYYVEVGSGNAFLVPSGLYHYDINVRQTIAFHAGDMLSGCSAFFNGDVVQQDTAYVQVLDSNGLVVSTLWSMVSGGPRWLTMFGPWTSWSWEAPADGQYTLVLGATTLGDDQMASTGMHDNIRVPENFSTLILLSIGILTLPLLDHARRAIKCSHRPGFQVN